MFTTSNRLETLALGAICLVLLLSGVKTAANTAKLKRSLSEQEQILAKRGNPIYGSENGIDIAGRPVVPMPPPFERRAVAFLIRSSSLNQDLDYWTSVSRAFSDNSGIRLVGYCNDDECIRLVRGRSSSIPFTVVAAGEVSSSQALIAADERGQSIIRSEEWLTSKVSPWRTGVSPEHLAEVIKAL